MQIEEHASGILPASILVVEDNDTNIMLTKALLEYMGYGCDVAHNGAEAVDILNAARDNYQFVLMDVQMPVMDGYTATRLIREEEEARGLSRMPIIGITAHALIGDDEKCYEAGMDGYITKPFRREEFSKRISDLMDASA